MRVDFAETAVIEKLPDASYNMPFSGMHIGLPKYVPFNLKDIVRGGFKDGDEISLETLKSRGLINPSGRERKLPLKVHMIYFFVAFLNLVLWNDIFVGSRCVPKYECLQLSRV